MNYNDVTSNTIRSTRCTNPLDPTYTIGDKEGKTYEVGKVDVQVQHVCQTHLRIRQRTDAAALPPLILREHRHQQKVLVSLLTLNDELIK